MGVVQCLAVSSIKTKMIYNDWALFSSDDDCQFRPAPNKRNKKKQKARPEEEGEGEKKEEDSSLADSESERLEETEDFGKSENCKDGKK